MKTLKLLIILIFFISYNANAANNVYSTSSKYNQIIYRNTNTYAESILVLTYHLLSENVKDFSDYCISPDKFENDVKYLIANNYTLMKANELYEYKKDSDAYMAARKIKSIKKIALITFDDGYDSDYKYVLPILKKYNIPATLFITGSYINKTGYLTEQQLLELSKDDLIEIGNHSFKLHDLSKSQITAKTNVHSSECSFVFADDQ